MTKRMTVSELARQLKVKPREISDLFYQRVLSDDLAPVIGGRRLIPAKAVDSIKAALERKKDVDS